MNKSRILSVALAGALVASVAAVSTISASAAGFSSADVKSHTVGITGDFAECETWTKDIAMTDDDGDGVYTAEITGQAAGTYGFKVRLDSSWDVSGTKSNWGAYEWKDPAGNDADRTLDSQHNCEVTVNSETDVIKVTFDTTKISDEALKQDGSYAKDITADDEDAYMYWPVTYTVEAGKTDAPAEESKTDAPAEESKKEDAPAKETSDTKPVATGDTTSAIALVGVVLASLGTAVVMTKKASSKD